MNRELFTSESVTEGHPDKVCDQIVDSLLDEMLKQDPMTRAAIEAVTTTGVVFVTGEATTDSYVDIDKCVRETIKGIGYDSAKNGFDWESCAVLTSIKEQSPDIAQGVNTALESRGGSGDELERLGAGDQGMMFGYACRETPELMPLPISLAHELTKKLADLRKNGTFDYLRPDGKSQVTVLYEGNKPVMVDAVVLSPQHEPDISHKQMEHDMINSVIKAVIPENLLDNSTKYYINPSGRFVVGGPMGDSGLTGRKIIADTYGGTCRHGGGSFSGKDATKVDRSASYMMRYVAKNLVAAEICEKCEVRVAYAIGVARPVSVYINTFGTGKVSEDSIVELINKHFDLRPAAIIEQLDMRKPIFKQVSVYGHFGRRDLDLPWERTDIASKL